MYILGVGRCSCVFSPCSINNATKFSDQINPKYQTDFPATCTAHWRNISKSISKLLWTWMPALSAMMIAFRISIMSKCKCHKFEVGYWEDILKQIFFLNSAKVFFCNHKCLLCLFHILSLQYIIHSFDFIRLLLHCFKEIIWRPILKLLPEQLKHDWSHKTVTLIIFSRHDFSLLLQETISQLQSV